MNLTPYLLPARRVLASVTVLAAVLSAGVACGVGERSGPPDSASVPAAGQVRGTARTLVLYDTTGAYGALGELYATQVANLVSRFGTWTAHPVSGYTSGEGAGYTAVVYIGSTYDEPLPAALLDDVAEERAPMLWLNHNIWQLIARHPGLAARYGFGTNGFDPRPVAEVRYNGTSLTRDAAKAGDLMRISVTDQAKARPVGEAVFADGTTSPWAVRTDRLTYLGELPMTYLGPDDRYLAFTDLLFDLLAPDTAVRHRALVRIEDVGPHSDPVALRAIADYLHGRGVPFSVAVFVDYRDPAGKHAGGKAVRRRLSEVPELVDALRYLTDKGGTLLMHGYTHQYDGGPNPYGISAEDFEFYRAHVDETNQVRLDGPVPEDSAEWMAGRLAAARAEWQAAGLPVPQIFEFPHYAASAVDYQTVSKAFAARYECAMYFPGVLSGGPVDTTRSASQFFPYPVRDVYGAPVIPETMGNVASHQFNQHGVRLPADLLASARRQLVVRDGVASFFYHPFLGLEHLPAIVEGMQAMGYTFVPPQDAILS